MLQYLAASQLVCVETYVQERSVVLVHVDKHSMGEERKSGRAFMACCCLKDIDKCPQPHIGDPTELRVQRSRGSEYHQTRNHDNAAHMPADGRAREGHPPMMCMHHLIVPTRQTSCSAQSLSSSTMSACMEFSSQGIKG